MRCTNSMIDFPRDRERYKKYLSSDLYNPYCYPTDWTYVGDPGVPSEVQQPLKSESKIQTDGGPSDYYDFPASWTTFNDFIEYKSEAQWGKFSFHLGNIGKALCRWGDKSGTTTEYDAKKIIYSGVRVLKMIIGTEKTRDYLQRLLDDPQFKGP